MALQRWEQPYAWSETNGTAVSNTVTETILFPDVTVRANDLSYIGGKLRIKASGQYSTTGTPTMVFSVRWGGVAGTLLCKSPTITSASGVTNAYWDVEVVIEVRTSGSSGAVLADGVARMFGSTAPTAGSATGAPAIAAMTAGGGTAPATATANLTTDTALSVTATWGTASASNSIQGMHYSLEWLN